MQAECFFECIVSDRLRLMYSQVVVPVFRFIMVNVVGIAFVSSL